MFELKTDPAAEKVTRLSISRTVKNNLEPFSSYSLGLHQLLTLQVLVSLVGTTDASAVHTPALLCVVALLGFEFAVALAVWVVDAVVVHEGRLYRLSSDGPGVQAFLGSVHLRLHQEALGDH